MQTIETNSYKRIIGETLRPIPNLVLNGHKCPKCNSELYDDRSIQLMTNPPQYKTSCESCGYKSTRFI